MNNNKNNKNKNKKQKIPKRNVGMTMYKSPRTVMPSEFDTNLKYIVYTGASTLAAVASSVRYSTNAYDVDPTLGSTAMPGFTEFAAFYKKFRTLKLSYKFSVSNSEAFPVTIIHGFSTTSISSGSLGIGYAGNPYFKTSSIGPLTGICTKTFQAGRTVCDICGTSTPLFDDLFTGSTTSSTLSTAGTAWCYLGLLTAIPFTAAGVNIVSEITLRVRFYSPNLLLV